MTDETTPVAKTRKFAGTPRVALVTCRAARGLDEDLPLLLTAFEAGGASAPWAGSTTSSSSRPASS